MVKEPEFIKHGFEITNTDTNTDTNINTKVKIYIKKSLLTECTENYKSQVKNGEAILLKKFKNVRLFRFPENIFKNK